MRDREDMVKFTHTILIGDKISIGKHTYGSPKLLGFTPKDRLIIGDYCSIAGGVSFLFSVQHRQSITTYPLSLIDSKKYPQEGEVLIGNTLTIGNDVWIGYGAIIFASITIGDGVIIGAKTVVKRDVLPYEKVVGCSCRSIGYRFNEEDIEFLLKIQWWDWSEETFSKYGSILATNDIQKLRELHKAGEV